MIHSRSRHIFEYNRVPLTPRTRAAGGRYVPSEGRHPRDPPPLALAGVADLVGGAWVCYEIIDTITDRLVLPEWLPVLAIVLFLVGLPFVVATACVREDTVSPAEAGLIERGPGEPAVQATRTRHHLTWRSAGLAFVFALALWGVVAAAWLLFAGGVGDSLSVAGERPTVAALPLLNRSGLQEDEYFTDGMHDEILTQLSKISGLSIRGRTSVMQYRDSPKNLREIGEELNARYLLEGGVLRAGETVRVSVQLIDARRDEHLWAETYDRQLSIENLLAIQSRWRGRSRKRWKRR